MLKGKLTGLSQDYFGDEYIVTFSTKDRSVVADFERLKDKDTAIELKQYREKRSLDANSYYWVLQGRLAAKLRISSTRLHNMLLRDYGTLDSISGAPYRVLIPDTDIAEETAINSATFHIKPTSEVLGTYRVYHLVKGSHEYDSAEMARLIDGLVTECKGQGIETLPPEEIERMIQLWHPK